ncbi:MAG: glycosyltransferase [Candidatus Levybacteria bacterium]|nr:glycosyltransferase [Candidatus Levybacteria bacterium]
MKKQNKKLTVTIGIPAYNEEANIESLLQEVREQKFVTALLCEIIVYSDASTDCTLEILKRMKMKSLRVLSGKKRMGKSYAMNQIIKHTASDILVLLDGDILIRDKHMIEKLIEPIRVRHADLTSARVKEFWAKTKFEEILKISMLLKKDIFESYKKGNNIYTCHGRARALSKKLYTSIRFKNNIVAEDAYAYLYAVYNKFTYIFAKRADVHYRLPGNFKDHQKQSVRFIQSYKQLAYEFGKNFMAQETKLPKRIVLPFVFRYFLRYPLTLFLYILILVYMKIRSMFVSEIKNTWGVAQSTKSAFTK